MAVRELRGARCLVTGASSGIGRALACALARHGARLLLTARRVERLEALVAELRAKHACEAEYVAGDVMDAAHRERLVEAIERRWQALDILINNAGSGSYGPFLEGDAARLRRNLEVNFIAPAELARICFPNLQRGRRPLLVNVGSVLGHRAVPFKSEYCAAKFALHGWSDAVRAEWASLGVDVLLVSPSTTASEFFEQVEVTAGKQRPQPTTSASRVMTPDEVARQTLRAIRSGRHEIILSWGGKLLVWADRLAPTWVNRLLAKTRRADENQK